ncbi:MAG: CooT family nickel-binding protein [Oscillospiraceae bacterium]|jgi:predicted RNA-binding protein|nr:CooT family nickel-binding protein [Oscillospiraceae bacterium]
MCLSTAYLKKPDGERTLIMKNVSNVRIDGQTVVLSDILGAETPIPGTLAYADLINGQLEIKSAA